MDLANLQMFTFVFFFLQQVRPIAQAGDKMADFTSRNAFQMQFVRVFFTIIKPL
jgi:hypothetical protein